VSGASYISRLSLNGRVALVTGGGRGIGLAAAKMMAEAGATVILSDRDTDVLMAGVREMADSGHRALGVALDVTDPAMVAKVAAEANAEHGAVDILVANAGIAWPDTGAEDLSDDAWRKVLDVDLNGVFWCAREFGRPMLARGRGAVVAVGSMSGLISNVPRRQAHYNAAKAGVHHLVRSLAGEWAPRGVRVNAVAPTYVETAMTAGDLTDAGLVAQWLRMTPMGRVAQPDEIASVIAFLASEAASAMTGAVVTVDCGYTVW
jgi:NAD(P)-dependent dehydrogenase (short-subunit alcohol dehydrogenase family)